ncbi:MAG: hypothetical protein ACM3KF_00725 [Acidobacteriota bacterium]
MCEIVPIDYRNWRGASGEELGYSIYEPVSQVHRYTHQDGTTHNILVVDARRSFDDPTILKSASINYRLDPLLLRRSAIEAAQSNSRIAIAELPGVSGIPMQSGGTVDYSADIKYYTESVRQTAYETLEAMNGNFIPLAQKQFTALADLLSLKNEPIEIHGESFGATIALALARVVVERGNGLSLRRIHLGDPANPIAVSTAGLAKILRNMTEETRRRNEIYLRENEAIGHGDITAFELQSDAASMLDAYVKRRQLRASILPVKGIRNGLVNILKDTVKIGEQDKTISEDTVLSASFHTDSLVGDYEGTRNFIDQTNTLGVKSELYVYVSGDSDRMFGHLALVSLGRVANVSIHMSKKRY